MTVAAAVAQPPNVTVFDFGPTRVTISMMQDRASVELKVSHSTSVTREAVFTVLKEGDGHAALYLTNDLRTADAGYVVLPLVPEGSSLQKHYRAAINGLFVYPPTSSDVRIALIALLTSASYLLEKRWLKLYYADDTRRLIYATRIEEFGPVSQSDLKELSRNRSPNHEKAKATFLRLLREGLVRHKAQTEQTKR